MKKKHKKNIFKILAMQFSPRVLQTYKKIYYKKFYRYINLSMTKAYSDNLREICVWDVCNRIILRSRLKGEHIT